MHKWPYIVSNGKKVFLERPTIEEPKEWQGQPTTRTRRGKEMANTYVDLDCDHPDIRKQKLKHWIGTGKKGIGIRGVGDTVLTALTDGDHPLVKTPADLYRLSVQTLAGMELENGNRYGESNARKLVDQIHANKTLTLGKFLGGLGVDLLGVRRAEIIAKETGLTTLDDWLDETKLRAISGDTIRESITTGLRVARPVIDELLAVGVVILPFGQKQPKPQTFTDDLEDGIADVAAGQIVSDDEEEGMAKKLDLTGVGFCFTGIRDAEAEEQITDAGGEIKSGVTKNLIGGYLVQKDPTSKSTKSKKADELGISVISIDTLRECLAGKRELPKMQNA